MDPHTLSFPEGTTSLHIEYKVACMCRCSMQCLLSVSLIFLDFIHFCRLPKISRTTETIYDRRSSLLRKDLCDLTRMFSETTTKLRRTKKPTCSYLSNARLQSSLPADLKHIILVFWNFHHLATIIDTGYSCEEKTNLAARCSHIYNCVIFALT